MIDPKEMLDATSAAQRFGNDAGAAMSEKFMEGAAGMSIDSSNNASGIIGGVQDIGAQMLAQMSEVKKSIDQQIFSHQDAQQRQKTYDFQPDMSDLRPSDAQGFPSELAGEFFAPFMRK